MKLKHLTAVLMALGHASVALAAAPFTIQDIRVEGLQRTEPATVFNYLPVKVGDTFTEVQGEEIIKNLYATGFFDDVRVETLGNQVLLTVVERPVISSLNVTGGKTLSNDAIRKNLDAFGLGQSRSFNQATLNQAIAGLQQEYRNRGKNSVSITPEITRLERNRVAVDVKIDEGPTTTITDIEFNGNERYSDRQLRNQMSLSEGGLFTWISKSNRFSDTKFRQDLESINDFYQNNGYFDFRITHVDVAMSEDKKAQTIKVDVHEGQRYRWGKVAIEGDTREVPKAELEKLLTMKEGRWYDRSKMMDSLKTMQDRMGSAGYAFSQIDVRPQANPETGVVDFTLFVVPDRKVYVNRINISGNNKTRDEVVRRELRQMESAPYDVSKIQRSRERVELLGYFDNVQIDAQPVAGTPDQVDLAMSVNERATGSLEVAAGWVQNDGLVLSAGVSQDNLFGTGKSVSARVSNAKVSKQASLSFTDPYFTPDGVSLGYDIYYRSYNPSKSDSNRLGYKTDTYGIGARMGVPVTEYDRVNFGLGVERLGVKLYQNPPQRYQEFVSQNGENNWIVKGNVGWGRNKTDSALWPTRGYSTSVNLDSGLPGGGLQYYSLTHDQKWFFPLSKDFTLMLGGEVGYANSYGKTKKLPFFQNFYGGGLGSVRGYENGSLGPKFKTQYIDNSYSSTSSSYGGNYKAYAGAELLFPLPGIKDQRTVRLSLFADAGSVWDGQTYNALPYSTENPNGTNGAYTGEHKSSFSNELRYSAGAAVTWLSPLGPMKFSYAYPIKKKPEDQIQRFQFQLGTTF
ncbi:outer membrane protein assembly factor BamA [Paralysiella testudinis]|uniref:Outer membrane protein assembly factor BamA n=1 Tax=Paralysiella testudinis TaxID=2809020 RepID=A0A892ZJK4_9NEIS|nr:outer membrane protein assembly factor BamA [Paralysiella testudinis]QRQ82608.1 outer membrane protein assembly factor BamA [Paralysiella testudinis]